MKKLKKEAKKKKMASKDKSPVAKKKQRKLEKQILVIFVVLVLALASFLAAYNLLKPKPYFKYEGFTVFKAKLAGVNDIFYVIPVSGGGKESQIILRNDPRTLNVSVDVDNLFAGISKVWITSPDYLKQGAEASIAKNDLGILTYTIGLNTSYALTNSSGEYPIMSCDNATKSTRVFMFDIGNETRVYEKDNCIIVMGEDGTKLVEAADSLIIKWLIRFRQ